MTRYVTEEGLWKLKNFYNNYKDEYDIRKHTEGRDGNPDPGGYLRTKVNTIREVAAILGVREEDLAE